MDLLLSVMAVLAPVLIVLVGLVWFYYIKPIRMLPLSNESDEGVWRVPLPQIGRILEGRVTTARMYLQRNWASLLDSSPTEIREKLVKLRDKMLTYHVFAIKPNSGDKALLLFTKNPLETQFHMREDSESRLGVATPLRFIYGIRECLTHGKNDGFEYIEVSLGETGEPFTDEERTNHTDILEGVKFLRSAATNTEALKRKEEQLKNTNDELKTTQDALAKARSEKNKAERAAALKNLNEPSVPTRLPFLSNVAKSFFTSFQLAVAFGTFIVTINVATYMNVTYPTPTTLGIAVAVIAFFVTPFIRGLINR